MYLNDDETVEEARASRRHFLEHVYTQQRLHAAVCYCPPAACEAALIHATSPELSVSFQGFSPE
jgi:hypothetical protein